MSSTNATKFNPLPVPPKVKVYSLKVTLEDVHPPLWRRLEVESDSPIDFVGGVIRAGFGWSFCHGSEFDIKGRRYGDPNGWVRFDPEQEYERRYREIRRQRLNRGQEWIEIDKLDDEIRNLARRYEKDEDPIPTLAELVPRVRTKFTYLFDFGDCWKHVVEVERIAPPEPGVRYPRCTDGAGADPIEDCGGAWRLTEMIRLTQADPQNALLQNLEHLIPRNWSPERFSLEDTNRRMAKQFPIPGSDSVP